jgi:F-type H+-transporting ATPase subunit b
MDQILNILGSVGFNWHVALANFINFLIILFLLNKFFFGKIGKTLQTRHDIIERGLSQASDAEKALAHAEEEKKTIVKNARKEGRDILATAEASAQALAESIAQEAEAQANAKMQTLTEKEAKLKDSVERDFAEQAPGLVARLYAKTLVKEMTAKDNDDLIARMSA